MDQEYLKWQTVRLSALEKWKNCGQGLAFVFPQSGVGKYVSGPILQKLLPGDVFVVSSAYEGMIGVSEPGELVFGCFFARLEHLFPLLFSTEICALQKVTDGFRTSKIYPKSSVVAQKCQQLLEHVTPELNLEHRAQLLNLIAAILTEEFKNARSLGSQLDPVEPRMIQVFEKLSVTELLELSVEDLAEKFSCSRRHLSRLFHQHFGFSVAALKMELRLMKAVSLLRDPAVKIINVAEQCGFNHLGLFNICFKRRFGTSPGQWRKIAPEKLPAKTDDKNTPCQLMINGMCSLHTNRDNSIESTANHVLKKLHPISK